ncbi:MAG: M23 family metallopeptidase [Stenomitos rutilans HA7619-LM2]|nr:M23 family metallopeptidase [Stenomitos rutilans HA7619-LM2]
MPRQTANITKSQLNEQATAAQRIVLKQRLADLVTKDKSRKEAKLRANLEARAIASAQAGEFLQARRLAQDQMLSSEDQATLLVQIDAIAGAKVSKKTVQQLPRSQPASSTSVIAPWKTAAPGRSRPSVLPYVPSSNQGESTTASNVSQSSPQYVGYSLNGFGRTIQGLGVVIDNNQSDINGQSWMTAYAPGSRFNAELWNGLSLIFPLSVPAPITSAFGWRVHPIRGDRRFHSGTDLGAPMGTPVLAAASGKVALSDWLGGYGLAIILSHQDDTQETLYGHLSKVFVKPGQWVEKGTVIGRVGSTGLSTGPHLHFELRQKTSSGWHAIDPGVQLKYALARLVKTMQSG